MGQILIRVGLTGQITDSVTHLAISVMSSARCFKVLKLGHQSTMQGTAKSNALRKRFVAQSPADEQGLSPALLGCETLFSAGSFCMLYRFSATE